MASVFVTLGAVAPRGIFDGDQSRSEVITSSNASAVGSLIAAKGDVAQIFCATAVYARSGGPTTIETAVYCPPNIPTYIGMTEGDVVSVLDA